jgi:DNA primase
VIRHTLSRFDLETVEGRVNALRTAAPIVADIRDPALRPGYTRELARMLGMELGEVTRAVRGAEGRDRNAAGRGDAGERGGRDRAADRREPAPRPARPGEAARGAPGEHRSGTPATDGEPARSYSVRDLPNDPATRLERDALQAMLQYPEAVGVDCRFGNATLAVVRDGIASALAAASAGEPARSTATATATVTVDRVVAEVPPPFASIVQQLAVLPVPQRDAVELTAYVRGVVGALVDRELLRQKQELLGRLQRTDRADTATYAAIQRGLVDLERERRALRGD